MEWALPPGNLNCSFDMGTGSSCPASPTSPSGGPTGHRYEDRDRNAAGQAGQAGWGGQLDGGRRPPSTTHGEPTPFADGQGTRPLAALQHSPWVWQSDGQSP